MFQIQPLPAAEFAHLNAMSEEELARNNIQVHVSDGAFPCRVSLTDVAAGTKVYLLNFEHQPGESPYRSRHAIFVSAGAEESHPAADTVPDMLTSRLLSVRAFNRSHEMIDADVIDGKDVSALISAYFDNPEASYIHLHFARRGCFAAKVTRTAWS